MLESIDEVGDTENSFSLLNYALNFFKPTKADLERVITKEEQIELILKHKCRVDVWRWNPVHEYRLAFEAKGRYQKWDNKKRLKMLAKSVNTMKPHEFVGDNKIDEIRKNEWEYQKRNSILCLELWAYDRNKKKEAETQLNGTNNVSDILDLLVDDIDEPERVDSETQSNGTDNVSDILDLLVDDIDEPERVESETQSNVSDMHDFVDIIMGPEPHERVDSETQSNVSEMCDFVDLLLDNIKEPEPHKTQQFECPIASHNIDNNDDIKITICNTENTDLTVNNPCEKHNSTYQPGQTKVVLNFDDEDVFLNVNTQSMSVDTQYLTQSQTTLLLEENQQVPPDVPPNYTRFDNEVPFNSTQAPSFSR